MSKLPRRRSGAEDGFTLVESLLALFIAGILFTALAGVLVTAVKTSVFGRQNQQAADLMTQRVEQLRLLDHASLALTAASDDDNTVTCAAGLCLPVEANGVVVNEPLVVDTGGAVTQQVEALQTSGTNQTAFTRRTYVTVVSGQPIDQVKRVTVVVTWEQGGELRTRTTSTIVAYTQRGLPVPVFKLTLPQDTVTKNPGSRITFKLSLANQGAPDRWDLALSGTGAGDGWTLAADTAVAPATEGDGSYDPAVDLELVDTSGNGIVDTGRLEPSTSLVFFLTRETSVTEPTSSKQVVVGATSVGQPPDPADPDTAAGYAEVTATAVLVDGVVPPDSGPTPAPDGGDSTSPADCTGTGVIATKPSTGGYTLESYVLHNEASGLTTGDTSQQQRLYMNQVVGDEPQLNKYSTDVAPAVTGRHAVAFATSTPTGTALLSSTDRTRFADWSFQTPKAISLSGRAVLRLWVARANAGTSPVSITASFYTGTTSGSDLVRTSVATGTVSVASLACSGFQEVFVPLDVAAADVAKNAWFGVRVAAVGTDPVRFAYDVPSTSTRAYPAGLIVGQK